MAVTWACIKSAILTAGVGDICCDGVMSLRKAGAMGVLADKSEPAWRSADCLYCTQEASILSILEIGIVLLVM